MSPPTTLFRYSIVGPDEVQWYRQTVELTPEGVTPIGKAELEPPIPTTTPQKHRRRRRPCPGCGVRVVRWLGIRWYGVPMPVRLWRRWVRGLRDRYDGCGCPVKTKNLWLALLS